jgi:hypothetical protein
MYYLLAQTEPPAVEPTERQVKAAEIAVEGFLKGIEGAAAQQPTNYLVVVTVVATLLAAIAVVLLFLRHLKTLDEKADAREIERQKHLESMAASYATESRQAQRECHTHSREMMDKRNADSETLKDVAHDLKDSMGSLNGAVTVLASTAADFRAIAHDTRGVLQAAQLTIASRPQLHDVTVHPPNLPKLEGES